MGNHHRLTLVPTLFLVMAISTPVFALIFNVEAEHYFNCFNAGWEPIAAIPGLACSGDSMLVGLDSPGDWTEYQVPVQESGVYELFLKSRGDNPWDYVLRLELSSPNASVDQIIDFEFRGRGYS